MHVKLQELTPGCILKRDVFKMSNQPLMRRKTVLNREHIHILQTFLVQSVEVEPTLVDGSTFQPSETLKSSGREKPNKANLERTDSFTSMYLKSVQKYKKHFQKWTGHMKVDPYPLREILLPLLDQNATSEELLELRHYSDKANYVYYHAVAVGVYAAHLGREAGMDKADVIQLGLSGMLADAGMSRLSFDPFSREGRLREEEYEEMKKHPIWSYRMIENVPGFNKKTLLGVLQHHEREDGSGYPLQVTKAKLHPFAAMVAVADVFHAMTAERKFRNKQSPYRVLEMMHTEEFGKLDAECIRLLLAVLIDLRPGRTVRLNNGMTGTVTTRNEAQPLRPHIQLTGGENLDLRQHENLYIEEASVEGREEMEEIT
ncbi:HD-GYP domain-containing protein [Alkalicoccus chagannorensis]|uniref:HD-GYP domain-containing protein n=1 Tax=Alkalicoccus chagannorensis TaxID=427072 RepID=UPI000422181F|nr:HD-GYP domain-containing protein [Alkalicoccus chagannorensis]